VRARIRRFIPPSIAGAIDLLRPSVAKGFGGPFNAQERRIEAVRDIFSSIDFRTVVETGTYRATTTLFLRTLTSAPIVTIEADPRFFQYSRLRLRSTGVTVLRGDSATVLRSIAADPRWNRAPAFFYLDAHWLDALPLLDEIGTIVSGWHDFVVLIDDFKVPGDAGYGYDDYGERGTLDVELLRRGVTSGLVVYWPAAPSDAETGARRGWVVLGSAGPMDEALATLDTLRRTRTLEKLHAETQNV
jgi:hypothetical protein